MCFKWQRYLQSTSVRLEEWRQKRTEAEQWMHHRQIPAELRQSVRKYEQYKWVATRGVEEKTIISSLPKDLQRKINHHLCYNLIKQVLNFHLSGVLASFRFLFSVFDLHGVFWHRFAFCFDVLEKGFCKGFFGRILLNKPTSHESPKELFYFLDLFTQRNLTNMCSRICFSKT